MTTKASWKLSVTQPPAPLLDEHSIENHRLSDGKELPPSYVSFVRSFGWGRLFGLWLVYTPVPPGHADGLLGRGANLTVRLREEFQQWQNEGYDWAIEPDGTWDMPQRLEVFAMSENGDYLGWDTGSRDENGEVQIYHTSRFNSLTRIGGNMHEAIDALRVRGGSVPFGAADFDPLDLTML
ncbi:SMI1/KNR4 family protein [Arthrobacter sp. GMC3]|uniref:SMI1/KNR4 family protein n=1 Tax=Arthrobacter sp. GMC3 TaxID=2058894 RepID=UPI000CE50BD4|nr:SMI1/KNR4 family protein [Arthrobacter sp. GMC3]